MIQANELRIGNLVNLIALDQIIEVESINRVSGLTGLFTWIHESEEYEDSLTAIEPIPLSPDILEKLGFEKVNHTGGYSFWSLIRRKRVNAPAIHIYDNKTEVMSYLVSHCQYLHQLQNLYFALTGSELDTSKLINQ